MKTQPGLHKDRGGGLCPHDSKQQTQQQERPPPTRSGQVCLSAHQEVSGGDAGFNPALGSMAHQQPSLCPDSQRGGPKSTVSRAFSCSFCRWLRSVIFNTVPVMVVLVTASLWGQTVGAQFPAGKAERILVGLPTSSRNTSMNSSSWCLLPSAL